MNNYIRVRLRERVPRRRKYHYRRPNVYRRRRTVNNYGRERLHGQVPLPSPRVPLRDVNNYFLYVPRRSRIAPKRTLRRYTETTPWMNACACLCCMKCLPCVLRARSTFCLVPRLPRRRPVGTRQRDHPIILFNSFTPPFVLHRSLTELPVPI